MMQNLRAATNTWAGRIFGALLMGLIVLSFVFFGIRDMLAGATTSNTLATIGTGTISLDAYRAAYERQLDQAGQRFKRKVTNDEARAAGLDTQLLNQMVDDTVFDQRVRRLGLAVPAEAVRSYIESAPPFKDAAGKFSQARYAEQLRESNLNAAGFEAEQRKTMLRRQLSEALAGDLAAPRVLLDAFNKVRAETRSIDTILLPDSAAGAVEKPSDDILAKYFAARAQNYKAPQYRKLTVLAVSPDALAKPDSVADADARKRYDDVKAQRYTIAEKRDVQQIPFPNEEEAKAAAEKIKGGASFESIAAERNLTGKDIDLGTVAKNGLAGAIGAAAFELAEGATSDPVKNLIGYSLVRAARITPAQVTPFESVAADLKKDIAAVSAKKTAQELHDKIEDARSGGKTLAEAARAAGLEVRAIDAIDAAGLDKAGAPVAGLPDAAALLRAAFASDVGVDNDTVATRGGGTIWFEVAGVEPARPRTLDEMRASVELAWTAEETARRLSDKAAELVKKLNAGETMAAIAEAEGKLEIKNVNDARRTGSTGLPPGVVAQAFAVPAGASGSGSAPGGRMIFTVLDAAVPPLDAASPENKALESQLRDALAEDIVAQYTGQARTEAGVKINTGLLRQVTGGESGGQ